MGWNYLSVLKRHRLYLWSFGINEWFHSSFYRACDYLDMPVLKIYHVSRRAPRNLKLIQMFRLCHYFPCANSLLNDSSEICLRLGYKYFVIYYQFCKHMGLLPETYNCGLRMRLECRERFLRHRGLAIPTCITAHAWRMCRDACRDR